jgi:hypothetical protein
VGAELVVRAAGAAHNPFVGTHNPSRAPACPPGRTGPAVLPWTTNDPARTNALIDAHVDGVSTDYPVRLRRVMADRHMPLPCRASPRPACLGAAPVFGAARDTDGGAA